MESQIVEYKESWRDEYLKWICGFANAHGGRLYIGIDDKGNVIGVKNAKKLLEDIPNKIQSGLGVVADVNKLSKNGLDYIEIKVNSSTFPISFRGEYHYRSGSTKQQLTGVALSEFIMRKTGVRWEDVTVDNITIEDLDEESFKIFRREAFHRKRMTSEDLNISNRELLDKLHLTTNGKLKRSAVLLFYHDPSIVQNGTHVQIGRFSQEADLQYQDIMDGSLLTTADKVIDLIYLKYLKAKVSYEHDRRIETYPYARDAVREAVYNAMIHNCYMFGNSIQIRIGDKEMIIGNSCILPDGWTTETLLGKHDSKPYNPDIAAVFYRAGYIEHWGRGIQKIFDACKELGAEPPVYEIVGNGIRVRFKAMESAIISDGGNVSSEKAASKIQSATFGTLDGTLAQWILGAIKNNPFITIEQMSEKTSIARRTLTRYINLLQNTKYIQRIGGKRYGHWKITTAIEQAESTETAQQEFENDEENIQKMQQKCVEKSVEKIIRAIRENSQITVKELTTLVGLSRRGVEKNIKNLQQKGIIRRIGPDKGGHWEIIESTKQ